MFFNFLRIFADYSGWIGETNNFTIGTDGSRQVLRVNGSNAPGEIFKAANLDSNNYIVEIAIRTTNDAANQPHPGFIFC